MRIAGSIAALFLLAACGASEDEPPRDDPQPKGHYVVDPETGATRASITNEDGTTILRAGDGSEGEVAELPTGFTVYPDAEIRSTVEVGRGERRSVTMTLASDAPPADMIAFYRAEAPGGARGGRDGGPAYRGPAQRGSAPWKQATQLMLAVVPPRVYGRAHCTP